MLNSEVIEVILHLFSIYFQTPKSNSTVLFQLIKKAALYFMMNE